MMLSSWETNGYCWSAWPRKRTVIARPARILTTCWRKSTFQEKLHLDPRELDDVVVLERVRRGADRLAVDRRAVGALDVRDEVALRTPSQHRNLNPGLAERGERLGELELLAGVRAGQQLDGAQGLTTGPGSRRGRGGRSRCCRSRCRGCRRRRGSRRRLGRGVFVGDAGRRRGRRGCLDRKSTRLNSSHSQIS